MQVPYWIRLPCVIALLATSAPSITFAQQGAVAFDVTTSTGNDTLYVGVQGSIIWSVDSRGNEISALTFPMKFSFSSTGNIIRPVLETGDGVDTAQFIYSPASSVFENRPFNETMGRDFTDNPDTLLFGALDFGGGGWNTSDEVAHLTFTPVDTGVIRIDTSIMAPAGHISALDPDAVEYLNFGSGDDSWQGPYTITVTYPPPCPPVCNDAWVDDVMYVYGDMVTGGIDAYDSDQGPGPLSYYVTSTTNSNGTGPTNPFVSDAAGNWSWQTQDANEDDVGDWEIVFGATDGLDSTHCAPVTFTVIAEKPLVCFGFECIEAFSGQDVCVGLIAFDFLNPCKELGGFDLLFTYDASLLTFTGMDMTGSILDGLGWEYLTYRVVSTNPAMIRIVAIADMNNSNQHPSGYCLDGLLANVCFRTTNDRNLACQSAWLNFYWDDCGDNTASSRDGNDLFIVADPANGPFIGGNAQEGVPGGGIISACIGETEGLTQFWTGDGGLGGPADHPCLNADPQKPNPEECLYFVNGKIKIKCPGDIDDRGDMNLNGFAYEIADAVLYSNYFIMGPSVFMPGIPGEAQVAASDINADGTPLTVADLVYLIRIITGDAEPIAEDLLGGGPKVAAVVGKLNVEAVTQGSNVTVKAASDLDMGAGLFTFQYTGTEIAEVLVAGRASGMDVDFVAENGELRVLLYNIADRAKVEAGSGEILNIATTGGGELELVGVEAATFEGGVLESNVSAKVLPTAYALHQNFPNPFNPSTSLAVDFPNASQYTLTIYNIAGQVVKTYEGQAEAGTLTIQWAGVDNRGSKVASGVYFYAVEATDFHAVKKMVLMK